MSALAALCKHQFTVDEYYRMAEMGFLRPDDRVELIEGEIIKMTPMGSRHAGVTNRLTHFFHGKRVKAIVSEQKPLRLVENSEPEPDIMLLKFRENFYDDAHPGPADVLLLIEVAESSRYFDRNIKFPLYARHGIQEAWLVDLEAQTVEVHRSPIDGGYQDVRVLRGDETLAPLAFPDCTLTVNAILGKE